MDISVVIPTYNRADLLGATLASVFAQALQPREIIVVDDGSTDHTDLALSGFRDRISVIRIVNSGSIVARNVGLRAATSPLVAFCDSDDLWLPEFLMAMRSLWRIEPSVRVAYSNFRIVREAQWTERTKFDDAPEGFFAGLRWVEDSVGVFDDPIVDRLIRFQPFFPSACVVDRLSMIAVGGWDEGVGRSVGDDFGTVLRLGELRPFGVVSLPLVGIRKHSGNFSSDTRAMNLGDANILEYVLSSRPSLLPYAAQIRRSVAQRRQDAFDSAFVDQDFDAAIAIYKALPVDARPGKLRLKRFVAGLPPALASRIVSALVSSPTRAQARTPYGH